MTIEETTVVTDAQLVRVHADGMMSGLATALLNGGAPPDDAARVARSLVAQVMEDPAHRETALDSIRMSLAGQTGSPVVLGATVRGGGS